MTQDELDAVRDTAYFLWEQAGRPEGRAQEFWRRAMEQFRRAKAYQLWLEEGQPEGKAEEHWQRAAGGEPRDPPALRRENSLSNERS